MADLSDLNQVSAGSHADAVLGDNTSRGYEVYGTSPVQLSRNYVVHLAPWSI